MEGWTLSDMARYFFCLSSNHDGLLLVQIADHVCNHPLDKRQINHLSSISDRWCDPTLRIVYKYIKGKGVDQSMTTVFVISVNTSRNERQFVIY